MIKAFISDLHLEEKQPKMAEIFIKFLTYCTKEVDSLFILGDFFEAWIGDDDLTPFNQMIIHALKDASTQGLKLYFTHGNRDFLIGKKFLRTTGCQLLAEESVIDLFGTPTLLMHGDTLCTLDEAYMKFRKRSRHWLVQKIFLMKSLKKRQALAENYREKSKSHVSTLSDAIMDVTPSEVTRVMQKHQVQHLIHGHTHRPFTHHFELNNWPATRIVLGAWHERGNALICREDNSKEVMILNNDIL